MFVSVSRLFWAFTYRIIPGVDANIFKESVRHEYRLTTGQSGLEVVSVIRGGFTSFSCQHLVYLQMCSGKFPVASSNFILLTRRVRLKIG